MLVRITEECFRGADRWSPGDTLDLEAKVAAVLIEAGVAVPVVNDLAIERR